MLSVGTPITTIPTANVSTTFFVMRAFWFEIHNTHLLREGSKCVLVVASLLHMR
jgi:hypothetical protein